jgi:ABC-type glycerol-3-phosphate transport system substrate-binding protein
MKETTLQMKKKLIFSAALVLSLGLAGCGADTAKEEKPKEETTTASTGEKDTAKEEKKDDVYFKDNEVKIDDLKIKITETKVIPVGQKGNEYGEKPVFAIWYETTNLSDKEIDPTSAWMAVFTAIQDNDPNAVNEIEVGGLPDDRFLNTQLENIKKDGTVENAVAYELDDLETPVT